MNKFLYLLILLLPLMASAQTDSVSTHPWKHNLVAGLNLTQVSFTNWAQGGDNALAWTLNLHGESSKQWDSITWTNTYIFAFGQTRLGNQGLRKTDDKIDITSLLTDKIGSFINPYAALTFNSQFARGYTYDNAGVRTEVSNFFDPGYLTQSLGAGYQPIPEIKTRIGAAVREIFTTNHTQYADDPATKDVIEQRRVEGGIEWVTDIAWQLQENLLFTSKIEVFSPVKAFDQTVLRNDNLLTAKISKYLSTSLDVQVINDKKVSPYTQVKETIAFGLSYTIF